MPEPPATVTEVTAFLQLPLDLGLHLVHVWTYESGEPWPGWDLESMGALIGVPGPIEPNTRPLYRLAFRRIRVPARRANEAVESAFVRELYPNESSWSRACRRCRLFIARSRRRSENRTAVAITRYQYRTLEQESEVKGAGIYEAVVALNDLLTAYGLMSHDPLIGPVALSDLPSVAPIVGIAGSAEGPAALRRMVSVHPWQEGLLAVPRTSEDLERSVAMFDAGRRGREPTFRILAMLHMAKRDLLAARHAPAVIAAGSAVELLVESTLRRAWAPAGLTPDKLPGVLKSGFRNQLDTHSPRVLDEPVDLDDASAPPGGY